MGKTVDIGGRFHSIEQGNVVAGANEIYDDTKGKKQDVINGEVDAALEGLGQSKQDNLTFDQTPTEDSTNPVTSGGVYAADAVLQQAIEAILVLIPSAASALNQLADKSFVNSSLATASATFRGTYNLVSDLHLSVTASHQDIATALASAVSTADNNDYCFVQIPTSDTSSDIRVTERYKFNGTVWGYEYDLNNSGFTAAQWAAINSGITALLVTKLGALPTAAELATSLAGKQNVLTFDNVPVSGSDNPVKSSGLYQLFTAIDAKFPSDASANNKLVAEDRLAAYVSAIIGALDASYNVTSSDGHVTVKVTQADGAITSVEVLTSDIASASALTTLTGRVSTNETDIANLQAAYAALTQSDVIIVNGALPSSGQQQNKIYRQPDQDHTPPQFYSDYMWNGSVWVLMATYNNAIDDEPTLGSDNLVKSGGVYKAINENLKEDSHTDLDISDEDYNVIARFFGGNFITKNFDSRKNAPLIDSYNNDDLDLSDEHGNVIARFKNGGFATKNFDSEHFNGIENSVQVNDGFTETSASDAQMVIDPKYGFVFLSYSASFGRYGEQHDKLMLSIFPLGQPEKVKSVVIGENGETSSNLIPLGDGSVRVIYSSSYYSGTYYYKDYIFNPNTMEWSWSEPQKMKMVDFNGNEVDVTRDTVNSYIIDSGYSVVGSTSELHIVGQIKNESGTLYGTLTGYDEKPVIWYSDDSLATIHPFVVVDQNGQFEADVEIFNSNICIVNRLSDSVSYMYAPFDSANKNVGTWSQPITLTYSIGSRPQITKYKEKLLFIYNIRGNVDTDFPDIQNDRTGMRMILSNDETFSDVYSNVWKNKYGIVYPRIMVNYDDIYAAWSDSRIGLIQKNGVGNVLQGKEEIRFAKLYL